MSLKLWRVVFAGLLLALIGLGLLLAATYALADRHQRRAQEALRLQRYSRALAELRQALRFRPGSAELHLLAGRTSRQAGDLPAAREQLEKCRELQGGVSEDLQLEEYLLRAQNGEVDRVRPFLLPYLVEEGPRTPQVLEALARAYMSSYRTALAWGFLARWLELEPSNVEALFRRGLWHAQRQNLKDAQADYRRAVEIDPERTDARLSLADIFKVEKKFEDAAAQYRAVLGYDPQEAEARLGLAGCSLEMGRTAEARQELEALPQDKREGTEACWVRGMVEMQEGRPEKAEPLLRKAFDGEPQQQQAGYQLLLCLKRLHRDAEIPKQRARLAQCEKDQKRLIKITTEELNASPHNPALHCELGEIYLRLKMTRRGLHWLLSAVRIDEHYRRAHRRLRDYYESLGPEGEEKAAYHRRMLARSG
jgi:tetratricopeptide (TPR) repeat protein